jgi:hypothetical protein
MSLIGIIASQNYPRIVNFTLEYLVVGGGGVGGGNARGGGAGAEVRSGSQTLSTGNTFTITVAGASATWSGNLGRTGASSEITGTGFTTVTSIAGQNGGDPAGGAGQNGGGSGGACPTAGVGAQPGSAGTASSITGSSITYGGGGGGGGLNSPGNPGRDNPGGAGGAGGGGTGGSYPSTPPTAGGTNLGGGSGGCSRR